MGCCVRPPGRIPSDYLIRIAPPWTGPNADRIMIDAGCTMTSIAMIANYDGLISKKNPFVPRWSPLQTSPVAIHETLQTNKGYSDTNYCQLCIDWENGLANAFIDRTLTATNGLRFVPRGGGSSGRAKIYAELQNRRPSLLWMLLVPDKPQTRHAVVVAGWDHDSESYLIFDPLESPNSAARPAKSLYGEQWESKIGDSYTVEVTGGGLFSSDIWIGQHSPIAVLVIDPSGRRTGFDPVTAASDVVNRHPGSLCRAGPPYRLIATLRRARPRRCMSLAAA